MLGVVCDLCAFTGATAAISFQIEVVGSGSYRHFSRDRFWRSYSGSEKDCNIRLGFSVKKRSDLGASEGTPAEQGSCSLVAALLSRR